MGNDTRDEMENAYVPFPKGLRVGNMVKTGIFLKIVEKKTGKEVHYGVQYNGTTQEIEALPELKVSVRGAQS